MSKRRTQARGHTRRDSPRRIRHGIKLRRKPDQVVQSWVSQHWLDATTPLLGKKVHSDGLQYARAGQTARLEITPGTVHAAVQGRAGQPYTTSIEISTFSSEKWRLIIDRLADEAGYAANLLNRHVPESIVDVFADFDLTLFPDNADEVTCTCTCAGAEPCKHVAAVIELISERLETDPLLIFTMRGQDGEVVVERLREMRSLKTRGIATSHAAPQVADTESDEVPIEMSPDNFWRPGPALLHTAEIPPSEHASHALLRRLGPSPLQGKFPLLGLLASIYDTVAASARTLRDQAEGIEPDDSQP